MIKTDYDAPHTFVVEGRGEFPFDMLRHSSAWPESTADAARLAGVEFRRVTLTGQRLRFINRERWASFGWPVVAGFTADGFPIAVTESAR